MPTHATGTREEWRAARLELLTEEKELTRHMDDVTRKRMALPWVPIEKAYRFNTEQGTRSLADLFGGRFLLFVFFFLFGPDWDAGCPICSSVSDGFNGIRVHLENHDVGLVAVSRAPLEKLLAYRQRMGWSFPWASSSDSDFNFDFNVSFTAESVAGGAEYNFRALQGPELDPARLPHEGHGMSAFALEDGVVYHTYSAYARGMDALWNMWQWLDRAPLGRNDSDWSWFHRHDEYEGS